MVEPKILTLGITGGIGSGKSYVASLLSERGIPVYDTDSRAKALYDEDRTLRQELIQLFGSQLYRTADGRLDRQALAKIIFGDREALAKVNALVHPAVRRDFLHWREGLLTEDMRLCALESALLLDAGLEAYADYSIAVVASDTLRLERAMQRDGVPQEAIRSRMAHQLPQQEMIRRCDYTIYNEPPHDLEEQIDDILTEIARDYIHLHQDKSE